MSNSSIPRVWRCGRYRLLLARTLVMGIVNVTPDSFSDGGDFGRTDLAIAHGKELLAQGAHILDVGGESTRPGSDSVTADAETARVLPVISGLAGLGIPVSIDTRNAPTARACVDAGASIINDVSGFRDPSMVEVAASCDAGLVVMHMLGEPKTMQAEPHYDDVVGEVAGYLLAQAAMLERAGVARDRIALDPGIGFGKTTEHNLQLLRGIPALALLGYPLLIGASRKRFIGEITGIESPKERVAASAFVAQQSAVRGATIVRVHDVAATVQVMRLAEAL